MPASCRVCKRALSRANPARSAIVSNRAEALLVEGFATGTASDGEDTRDVAAHGQGHARDRRDAQPLELLCLLGSGRLAELRRAGAVHRRTSGAEHRTAQALPASDRRQDAGQLPGQLHGGSSVAMADRYRGEQSVARR